jgi:hypothetical protein
MVILGKDVNLFWIFCAETCTKSYNPTYLYQNSLAGSPSLGPFTSRTGAKKVTLMKMARTA